MSFKKRIIKKNKSNQTIEEDMTLTDILQEYINQYKITCDCCKKNVFIDELADDIDRKYYYESGLYYEICRNCVLIIKDYEKNYKPPEICGRKDKDGFVCDNTCSDGYEYCSDCMELEIC